MVIIGFANVFSHALGANRDSNLFAGEFRGRTWRFFTMGQRRDDGRQHADRRPWLTLFGTPVGRSVLMGSRRRAAYAGDSSALAASLAHSLSRRIRQNVNVNARITPQPKRR